MPLNDTAPAAPVRVAHLFGLRAFMRFWYARLAATTGNQMLMVAVGWQMYEPVSYTHLTLPTILRV